MKKVRPMKCLHLLFLMLLLASCASKNSCLRQPKVKPGLSVSAEKADTPRSFVKNYGISDNARLFAFVGKKISVSPIPTPEHSMDNAFAATYAILKTVYGDFDEDTISFVVYDHYGWPAFAKYRHVLLYVSADSGTYYHQKYLYNAVYLTKDGQWAGPYVPGDYEQDETGAERIEPKIVPFAQRVAYPLRSPDRGGISVAWKYPAPYYRQEGDSAIAIYGNYAEELFDLKLRGVLKARGVFD